MQASSSQMQSRNQDRPGSGRSRPRARASRSRTRPPVGIRINNCRVGPSAPCPPPSSALSLRLCPHKVRLASL